MTEVDQRLRENGRTVTLVEMDNPPNGWTVTLSCGHSYWTPVNVAKVGDGRMCAQCVNDYVAERKARP